MIAYKGTYGMKCRNITYEIGKTYSITALQMCRWGFHVCQEAKDVLKYYQPYRNFILLEVEVLGKVITKDDKSVTDKIKIIRNIDYKEHNLYKSQCITDGVIPSYIQKSGVYLPHYEYCDGIIKITGPGSYYENLKYDKFNNLVEFESSWGGWKLTIE